MAKEAKKAFGGVTINFKGQTATLEQVMGAAPVGPGEMSKKLWEHIRKHKLRSK